MIQSYTSIMKTNKKVIQLYFRKVSCLANCENLLSEIPCLVTKPEHCTPCANTVHYTCISTHSRTNIQTPYLVLVKFTVFVLFLSLLLKCDDHETNEDVHHEERDDDDIDDEEDGDLHTVVIDGTQVLPVGVDGLV